MATNFNAFLCFFFIHVYIYTGNINKQSSVHDSFSLKQMNYSQVCLVNIKNQNQFFLVVSINYFLFI